MHRPCLFRRQNTNTHTNRCLPPLASTMAETLQLETAYNRDYPSRSAQIEKVDACNKQGTKARWHLAMQNENMSQGEEGVHNRMAGGGAGQHTTQANETLPLQERRHLAATTRGPTHTWTPRAADHTDVGLKKCKLPIGLRATVGPLLAITHRRQARRLRLQPRQQHRQREAKGRSEMGRDGAWVRRIYGRKQSQCSQDPPAHFRGGPIRRYSGCPQPVPSSAGSPNAHAMLLGIKTPASAPHWKDRHT